MHAPPEQILDGATLVDTLTALAQAAIDIEEATLLDFSRSVQALDADASRTDGRFGRWAAHDPKATPDVCDAWDRLSRALRGLRTASGPGIERALIEARLAGRQMQRALAAPAPQAG